MTSDPAAKDGRGHTRDFMPDEWGSFQFTTSADAKRAEHMFNQLSSDRDCLRERVKELENALQKIANHEGVSEIIARIALSKSPK